MLRSSHDAREAAADHTLVQMSPEKETSSRHLLSIAIIVISAVALFWRVFFLGQTLIDLATQNNQLPWGYYAGRVSDYPYDRRDLTDMYITRDYFVVQSYRDGELPLWNPYTMAGHPIYADGVARTFSPFLLFYKFLDLPLGYSVARITELILAAVFMYLFLIAIGVSARGSLMGALVFEFSSHSMFHLTALGWWGGLMWLPLILLFAHRAVRRRSFACALLSGVFLAVQIYCGFFANQIYYVSAVLLFYLYYWWSERRSPIDGVRPPVLSRTLALGATTLVAGLGLSATQWLPILELLKYSNRLIVPTQIGYIYLPPWYALTLIFPHLFGSAYDPTMHKLFVGLGVSFDHILYPGIAALLPLGFLAYRLVRLRGRRRPQASKFRPSAPTEPVTATPILAAASDILKGLDDADACSDKLSGTFTLMLGYFALLTAISLFAIMAAPLYVHITRFLPVLQVIRVIMRAAVLFTFGAAALVAIGMDLLLSAPPSLLARFGAICRRFALGALSLVALAALIAYSLPLVGFHAGSGPGRLALVHRAVNQFFEQFRVPGSGLLLPLGLMLIVCVLIKLLAQAKISRAAFHWTLVALLVCDLFWMSRGLNPSFDRARVFPRTQITDFISKLPPGRVLVTPSDIDLNLQSPSERSKIIAPPNTLLPYRISVLAGKDQLFPKAYKEFCSLAEPQQNLSHVVFNISSSPYLNLLNARYVLTHDSSPAPKDSRLLFTAEGLSLYENPAALPRAYFAGSVIRCDTQAEALTAIKRGVLASNATVVVSPSPLQAAYESPEHVDGRPSASSAAPSTIAAANTAAAVSIVEDKRNSVRIITENPNPGLLVLSDNYYPGWKAFVDGAPAPILNANWTMRAVEIPAGAHVVSFIFAPRALAIGAYASGLSAIIVVIALILLRRKWRP
jgi:hypothetical protein